MVEQARNCAKCIHKDICSIKPEYDEMSKKLYAEYREATPEHFDIVIRCKMFRQDNGNIRTPFVDKI